MKHIINILVITCIFLMAGSVYASSSSRVGYVDVKEVLSRSRWGSEVEKEVNKQKEKLQAKLLEKGKAIKEKREQLEKKRKVLDSKARQKQSEELQKLEREMNELAKHSQTQYAQLQQKLLGPLFGKLKEVIQQIAHKDHYDYVLNKGAIMYDSGKDDLTDRILVELDKATPANPLSQ